MSFSMYAVFLTFSALACIGLLFVIYALVVMILMAIDSHTIKKQAKRVLAAHDRLKK